MANCWKDNTHVARLLLEAGADPRLAINYGTTPLDQARLEGKDACIQLLEVCRCHIFFFSVCIGPLLAP
jgi:ankyrin repeat protein